MVAYDLSREFNFFIEFGMEHGADAAVKAFSCTALLHKLFIVKGFLIFIDVGHMSPPESK